MTFRLIDETLTNAGFWVKLSGIDLEQFRKNPIMYFQHIRPGDYENNGKDMLLPIGTWENIRIENNALLADPVFDTEDDFGKKIQGKVERGIIKMASPGLRPVSWDEDPSTFIEGQTRPTLAKSIMVEASIVDRGLNNNAMRLYDDNMKEISLADAGIPIINKKVEQKTKKMKDVNKLLNLADDAGEDLILSAIRSLVDEKKNLETRLADLDKDLKIFRDKEAAARKAEIKTLLDDAVKARKITEDKREAFEKLFDKDFENAQAVLESLTPVRNLADEAGSDEDNLHKDWKWDEWHKSGKIAELKDKDPEGYKRLYKDKFGKEPNEK